MMAWLTFVALGVLASLGAALLRVWRGPGRADRMMGAQLAGTSGVAVLVLLAPVEGWAALDVALILALLGAFAAVGFVKAGLFGLILFIPENAFGPILMVLGLAGAFGAALWGLTQANPKAVLAYSTISQMGLMVMLVGAGGAARATAPYIAMHHGLAKGALFLLVGVMMAAQSRGQRILCLALAAAVSASVAGFPLTGGALAKAAVKEGLAEWAALALSLSSVATSLILVWFLSRLWRTESSDEAGLWVFRFSLPSALALSAFAAPWLLWGNWSGHGPDYVMKAETLMDTLWPVAMALPPAAAVLRWRLPRIPPGDLLLAVGAWQDRTFKMPDLIVLRTDAGGAYCTLQQNAARLEGILIRWRLTGVIIPLLVLLIFALLL